jgi:hypothetical protein
MPRGNDKEGQEMALHELADSFGQGAGNAEQLIIANTALRTADLATVSAFKVDPELTAELDLDELEGPNGEYVVDASVRRMGRAQGTVVLFQAGDGRLHKYLYESNLDETRGTLGGEDTRDSSGKRRPSATRAKSAEGEIGDKKEQEAKSS